jgi:hypothetical protein
MAKTTTFVSQLIEVLRRIMWNLYRVEWQCVKEDPEAVSRVLELRQHRQETAVRTDMGTTPVRYCVLPLLCARPLLSPPPHQVRTHLLRSAPHSLFTLSFLAPIHARRQVRRGTVEPSRELLPAQHIQLQRE